MTALTFDRPLDLARMRAERHARLVTAMRDHDVETLLLLGQSNVVYATGLKVPAAEMNQSLHRRAVALVTADGAPPHVWSWYPEGVATELPADHVHSGLR